MSGPTRVTLLLNTLNVSDVERSLSLNENVSRVTLGEVRWRAMAMEIVLRVDLLQRALSLVEEALDLAAEPLRRIEGVSIVTEEGDSSESEEDFKECSSE